GFLTAFPDLHVETTRAFGRGDWVCVEHITSGTHTGPMGTPDGETIPATNKKMRFEDALVFKVENDKITRRHLYFDQLGFMAQLGLAPEG
ncbi:MAG: ester cyclase, partial [Candidatus Geothermarchaeales archaeon]